MQMLTPFRLSSLSVTPLLPASIPGPLAGQTTVPTRMTLIPVLKSQMKLDVGAAKVMNLASLSLRNQIA